MYLPGLPLTEFPGQFFLNDLLRNPLTRMDYTERSRHLFANTAYVMVHFSGSIWGSPE